MQTPKTRRVTTRHERAVGAHPRLDRGRVRRRRRRRRRARTARSRSPWRRSTSSATRTSSRSATPRSDDIKIEQVKVGTWDDAKANLYTKLAAGSGLSDIEAIEGDAMPAILAECDAFADLTDPELDGRWLDWKAEAGTNADGQMIGYGTDIGPEGICYRADLFEKAGLPTDREEVAELMGTWDDYFATRRGVRRRRCPTPPGTTPPAALAQAMLNQVENPFETDDNTVDVDNPEPQGRLRHRHRQRRDGPLHHASPSGATTGPRPSRTTASPRWPARAGCSASSRATPRASRAGTSPTSSPAAAATGAARS